MAGTRGSSWRPPPPLPPPVPPRTYREHWFVVDGKLRPKVPQRPPPGRVPKLYEQLAFVSVPATGIKSDLHDRAQKAFTMYYIQVDCKNGCGWTVQRRFRELFKFALRIKHIRKSGVDHNVKFPSRFSRKASLSSTLIEQRRRGIEVFLSACVQSVALANPAQNWQDVGRALEELFLMQDNYRTSSIDFKPRIPYGSFQVKSTPSGLLIDADAKTLQAQALMRHALTRQSRTIELPSANVERRRKLSSSLRSSAKGDPAENVCLKLGRLVAMQQGQVDRFASKMLQIYPARDLEVAERRLRESPTDSLSARPSFRDLFRKKRDPGRRTGSNHIATTPLLSTTPSHASASRDDGTASPASGRAEELLHRVHRFLTQISWKLVEANPDTVNESKEFGFDADFCFDMTHRLFEAALLERHGDLAERLLFAASACAAAFEDDSLVHEKLCDLQKTYRGRGIPPALFGAKAHPQFCTDASCGKELGPGKSFAWGWEEAVEVMNRLTNESLPTAKVETILECVAEIHRGIASSAAITMSTHEEDAMGVSSDGIEDAASFHIETKSEDTGARSRLEKDATETLAETTELEELDGSAESISPSPTRQTMPFKTPKAVGADDFVPIFIYVIACSNLRQPWTLHKFMSTLASDSLLSTEAKYWLTVLESGLFFLANAEF